MGAVHFPAGFRFGAATSAYQIEGSWQSDGKGESIWDRFAHTPGKIRGGETGDVACDSYRRWKDDLAVLRELRLQSYRFSIAWPRIQPLGRGAPSAKGLEHYSRLVDALLEAGIRPLPTLYHWDLPQALEDVGGWAERDLAGRFADYAEIVAKSLGDRVTDWILLNEPGIFTLHGYLLGVHAPGRREPDAFLRATHVANLAQGLSYRALKAIAPRARVGTALNLSPCEPERDTDADAAAAERWHAFHNEWFLTPALRGRYPDAFLEGAPLERMQVREGDLDLVRVDLDFLGINFYSRSIVRAAPDDPNLGAIAIGSGRDQGPRTDFGWEVWPSGLRDILLRMTADHGPIPLEVTENGCSYADAPDDRGRVRDSRRIAYLDSHLGALLEAIDAGADVRSYHVWSLLDNFEWAEGTRQRFGLVHVDFATGRRTLKESGRWYARVASGKAL
ncbi:beta-glucosidase [Myxococcaceae bacterium]|nr:beta-glucosidase [Myxococcaceae bacterium]